MPRPPSYPLCLATYSVHARGGPSLDRGYSVQQDAPDARAKSCSVERRSHVSTHGLLGNITTSHGSLDTLLRLGGLAKGAVWSPRTVRFGVGGAGGRGPAIRRCARRSQGVFRPRSPGPERRAPLCARSPSFSSVPEHAWRSHPRWLAETQHQGGWAVGLSGTLDESPGGGGIRPPQG